MCYRWILQSDAERQLIFPDFPSSSNQENVFPGCGNFIPRMWDVHAETIVRTRNAMGGMKVTTLLPPAWKSVWDEEEGYSSVIAASWHTRLLCHMGSAKLGINFSKARYCWGGVGQAGEIWDPFTALVKDPTLILFRRSSLNRHMKYREHRFASAYSMNTNWKLLALPKKATICNS